MQGKNSRRYPISTESATRRCRGFMFGHADINIQETRRPTQRCGHHGRPYKGKNAIVTIVEISQHKHAEARNTGRISRTLSSVINQVFPQIMANAGLLRVDSHLAKPQQLFLETKTAFVKLHCVIFLQTGRLDPGERRYMLKIAKHLMLDFRVSLHIATYLTAPE